MTGKRTFPTACQGIDPQHFKKLNIISSDICCSEFNNHQDQNGEEMKLGLFLLAGLMGLVGCGSDEELLLPGTPPVISDLNIDPTSAVQGEGEGSVTVRSTYSFTDPDGDLLANRVCWEPCGGGEMACDTVPVRGAAGIISSTVTTLMPMSTTCTPGDYGTDLTAINARGNESNTLEATFTITAP